MMKSFEDGSRSADPDPEDEWNGRERAEQAFLAALRSAVPLYHAPDALRSRVAAIVECSDA